MLLRVINTPTIKNGIPIGEAITVIVKIRPTIMKTNPKSAPTKRPVIFKMKVNNIFNVSFLKF